MATFPQNHRRNNGERNQFHRNDYHQFSEKSRGSNPRPPLLKSCTLLTYVILLILTSMGKKPYENTVGKGETVSNKLLLYSITMFSSYLRKTASLIHTDFVNFFFFNLDKVIILSSALRAYLFL